MMIHKSVIELPFCSVKVVGWPAFICVQVMKSGLGCQGDLRKWKFSQLEAIWGRSALFCTGKSRNNNEPGWNTRRLGHQFYHRCRIL